MPFENISPSSIVASTNLSAPASGFAGGNVAEATVLAVAELMATGAQTATPTAGGTLTSLDFFDFLLLAFLSGHFVLQGVHSVCVTETFDTSVTVDVTVDDFGV